MATFTLRRFANPETLKAIQPEYLFELLDRHNEYFLDRGFNVNTLNGNDADYEGLVKVLMNPEPGTPPELVNDLYFVHEMADKNGMDELMSALDEMPGKKRLKLDLSPDSTPADVAIQVRLRAPEVLERRHAERFLTKKRTFEYFQSKPNVDTTFVAPDKKTLANLEAALDDRLDELKRGRSSKFFIYEKDDGIWFLIRHGQPCKREGTITETGSGTAYYRPEIHDVLHYNSDIGELSMNAETKKIGILYREKIGLHLFGDSLFFPGEAKYTLDPLKNDGEKSLVCSDVDGIEEAKLKELLTMWGGPENEIEIRKASDLFKAFGRREKDIRGRIARANFSVMFTDSKTPRTVSIRPPNVASYTRDSDAVIVEAWLKKRNFILKKKPSKHGD